MHYEPKFYKLKLLRKFIIQHAIRTWFDMRSWIRVTSPQFACSFPNLFLLSPNLQFFVCVCSPCEGEPKSLLSSPAKWTNFTKKFQALVIFLS